MPGSRFPCERSLQIFLTIKEEPDTQWPSHRVCLQYLPSQWEADPSQSGPSCLDAWMEKSSDLIVYVPLDIFCVWGQSLLLSCYHSLDQVFEKGPGHAEHGGKPSTATEVDPQALPFSFLHPNNPKPEIPRTVGPAAQRLEVISAPPGRVCRGHAC